MNVQTHEMDSRIARIHYADYLKRVRSNREKRKEELKLLASETGRALNRVRLEKSRLEQEDEELLTAYRELSRSRKIVILPEAMKTAGVDSKRHLPKLAIVRADSEHCYFNANVRVPRASAMFRPDNSWKCWNTRKGGIVLPRNTFPAETWNIGWRLRNGLDSYPVKAKVPKVPPRLCPDSLSKYYILFEPIWESSPPYLDPILLSRSSETVFVVVATWDMTPLEASIINVVR